MGLFFSKSSQDARAVSSGSSEDSRSCTHGGLGGNIGSTVVGAQVRAHRARAEAPLRRRRLRPFPETLLLFFLLLVTVSFSPMNGLFADIYIYIYKFSVLVFLWFCFFLFSSWNREAIVARFLTRTSFGVSSPCFSRKRKKARARAGLGERLAHVLPRLRTAPNESGVLFMTPNDRPLSENSKRCF